MLDGGLAEDGRQGIPEPNGPSLLGLISYLLASDCTLGASTPYQGVPDSLQGQACVGNCSSSHTPIWFPSEAGHTYTWPSDIKLPWLGGRARSSLLFPRAPNRQGRLPWEEFNLRGQIGWDYSPLPAHREQPGLTEVA